MSERWESFKVFYDACRSDWPTGKPAGRIRSFVAAWQLVVLCGWAKP